MRGKLWLTYFTRLIDVAYQRWDPQGHRQWQDPEWTQFLREVMEGIGSEMDCHVVKRQSRTSNDSYEYLNIDAMFIDNTEYDLAEEGNAKYDPFVLPRVVIELENNSDCQRISYCLWKILCVRSRIRVLICYQKNRDDVNSLRGRLEEVIWQGSLMKGTDGDLLIIIDDESVESKASWGDYFSVYEWRSDRLERIDGLAWA